MHFSPRSLPKEKGEQLGRGGAEGLRQWEKGRDITFRLFFLPLFTQPLTPLLQHPP